jgi:hypothetical protein
VFLTGMAQGGGETTREVGNKVGGGCNIAMTNSLGIVQFVAGMPGHLSAGPMTIVAVFYHIGCLALWTICATDSPASICQVTLTPPARLQHGRVNGARRHGRHPAHQALIFLAARQTFPMKQVARSKDVVDTCRPSS